jgi:hypothetical protein
MAGIMDVRQHSTRPAQKPLVQRTSPTGSSPTAAKGLNFAIDTPPVNRYHPHKDAFSYFYITFRISSNTNQTKKYESDTPAIGAKAKQRGRGPGGSPVRAPCGGERKITL